MAKICPAMSGMDLDGNLIKVPCLEHECSKWINVVGNNPQTGESINHWDCADAWTPLLLIENSKVQRETGAAVESFRNEMVKSNEELQKLVARPQLIPVDMSKVKLVNGPRRG